MFCEGTAADDARARTLPHDAPGRVPIGVVVEDRRQRRRRRYRRHQTPTARLVPVLNELVASLRETTSRMDAATTPETTVVTRRTATAVHPREPPQIVTLSVFDAAGRPVTLFCSSRPLTPPSVLYESPDLLERLENLQMGPPQLTELSGVPFEIGAVDETEILSAGYASD